MAYKKNFYSKEDMQKKHNEYEEKVADMFIKALKEEKAPWQRPWNPITSKTDFNMFTMNDKEGTKVYQGYNYMVTSLTRSIFFNSEDPRWMTMGELINYNKKKFGEDNKKDYYYVRAGETGTMITYYSPLYFDKDGKKIDPQKMSKEDFKNKLAKTSFILKDTFVFNASQTAQYDYDENGKIKLDKNGNKLYKENSSIPYNFTKSEIEKTKKEFESKNEIEKFIKELKIDIKNDSPEKSFFDPAADTIHLPPKEAFHNSDEYYQTLLHEIVHWTGHNDRLARVELKEYSKDRKNRAKEELVAEIGSFMLCQKLNHKFEPTNNSKEYVSGWVSIIEDQPEAIKDACYKASKAVSHIMKRHEQNINSNTEINITVVEKKENKVKGRT